jgi:hypothetical protein
LTACQRNECEFNPLVMTGSPIPAKFFGSRPFL